jgi:cytochrome c peroxidase
MTLQATALRTTTLHIASLQTTTDSTTPVPFSLPHGWPAPAYSFATNRLTNEGIALGRMLFHDPILSRDSMISCASCHQPRTAFAHIDHQLSHGIGDAVGTRNAPALVNLAWQRSFHWDGAINHLDVQSLAPITHPQEMGEEIAHVVNKLAAIPRYKRAFEAAFGKSTPTSTMTIVTGERLLKALAQFMITLVSAQSKYDHVMHGKAVFTKFEQQGYSLYKLHCASCHSEPLFTNNGFANNGLPPDTNLRDIGRMAITHNPKDSLTFKVPTLRNVEVSYPYMHDGRFENLEMVLFHYTEGIHSSPTLAPVLRRRIELSEEDKRCLVAFLRTLTDEEFLHNPAFQPR